LFFDGVALQSPIAIQADFEALKGIAIVKENAETESLKNFL
jgi:hypothetical protein